MNNKVDTYLMEGCGRCAHYQTPHCKVHTWSIELIHLRRIVLECGLKEELKWSQPCYTFNNKNVLLVTAFKNYATLAFFKGTLLKDTNELLVKPGDNSHAVKQMRFTDAKKIIELEAVIKAYVYEAMEVEKAGLEVEFTKEPESIPEELQQKMNENKNLKKAFEALTPGRQRGYILHFMQPKQSKTRMARVEKNISKILKGEGLQDNYNSNKK